MSEGRFSTSKAADSPAAAGQLFTGPTTVLSMPRVGLEYCLGMAPGGIFSISIIVRFCPTILFDD